MVTLEEWGSSKRILVAGLNGFGNAGYSVNASGTAGEPLTDNGLATKGIGSNVS